MSRASNREDEVAKYFDSTLPPATPEQEKDLFIRYQAGCNKARDEIVARNVRFVITIAKDYKTYRVTIAELISAGCLGLLRAMEKFDHEKDFKFISYAVHWIRQSIRLELQALSTVPMKVSSTALSDMTELRRANPEAATSNKVAAAALEESELSEYRKRGVRQLLTPLLWLDQPTATTEGRLETYDVDLNLDEDYRNADIIDLLQEGQINQMITSALEVLEDRERMIVERYYGLDGDEPVTLEEIARSIDRTRERVRQIRDNALRKITQAMRKIDRTEVYA